MSIAKIRTQVAHILREAGVTEPPIPVERIAQTLGAEVRREPFAGDISGALLREPQRIIIGVNALHAKTRQRFTIAHELGHLVLHEGHLVHYDRAPFRINLRNAVSSQAVDSDEIEANRFAAELLMPEIFLKKDMAAQQRLGVDVSDDNELEILTSLARCYEVSVQAMAIRLATLGFAVEV